jgi:PTS system ascorbate-specific IIA component
MSVGVLLITHGRLGEDLMYTVSHMLGKLPLTTEAVSVHLDHDPNKLRQLINRRLTRLNGGEGVLVLTDTYGSTPSNIAISSARGPDFRVVAGLNVPMLIRVYNYPRLPLAELARIAHEGGQRGIIVCDNIEKEYSNGGA